MNLLFRFLKEVLRIEFWLISFWDNVIQISIRQVSFQYLFSQLQYKKFKSLELTFTPYNQILIYGFLNLILTKPKLTHCKENPIYVFIFWELRGLSPNFHIHVSVSDLYIPRISPHISLQQNKQTDPGNISISHRYMSVGTWRQNIIIMFGK